MTARSALVFRLGARTLAVDAAQVAAVARRPRLSRVPHAPAALAGVGAFDGRATPVIELARLLDDASGHGEQVLLLRGGDAAAVAVDFVEGVRERSLVSCEWLDLRATIAPLFQHRAQRAPRATAGAAVARLESAGRDAAFLAFLLAGQRFAFPMAQVRAVLRDSGEATVIPGADPVVVGVTSFREGVLPVVELARLLGLPTQPADRDARVIVVEVAGAPVGLRVERTLGALRIPERAVSPAPAALNRGAGEARVNAIALTASGLTPILAADRLFDEATMQRLAAMAVAAPAPAPEAVSEHEQDAVVVFRVGEDRYGLPAAAVEAVAAPGMLSSAPNAPDFVAGVMSHRGAALPVVDARRRFGVASATRGVVVVVRRDAVAAGLWVDAVERIAHLPRSTWGAAPALAGDAGALLVGATARDAEGRPLLVVDPDALLAQAQRDVVADAPARARRERA